MITDGDKFSRFRVFIIFSLKCFRQLPLGLPWEFSGLKGCSEALTGIRIQGSRIGVQLQPNLSPVPPAGCLLFLCWVHVLKPALNSFCKILRADLVFSLTSSLYAFGEFRRGRAKTARAGLCARQSVALTPKSFEVLLLLIEHSGQVC